MSVVVLSKHIRVCICVVNQIFFVSELSKTSLSVLSKTFVYVLSKHMCLYQCCLNTVVSVLYKHSYLCCLHTFVYLCCLSTFVI